MKHIKPKKVLLLFLVLLVAVLYFHLKNKYHPPLQVVPKTTLSPPQFPQTQKISINNVVIPNFYQELLSANNNGDVVILQTSTYQVVFIPRFHQFLISITSQPFDDIKTQAEAALLSKLEITTQEACQLNINISTPHFVNPELAGQVFKPSFCN